MSKYHARRTEVDNIWFDSQKEANRYSDLKLLVRAGTIHDLELQPEFPIVVNGQKICVYRADFAYKGLDGKRTIEDVKSGPTKTPVYRLKKRLVEAIYGIRILET